MNRYYYDLHVHSCLSPCGDDDMTPNNIAGMAALNGLNIVALTDHNSAKNCPAFFAAAKRNGIIPVAGVELTTAEDIHAVCLFPELENAMDFDSYLQSRRIMIPNRTDIFGNQFILDGEDNIIGSDDNLLSNATDISVEEAPSVIKKFGGLCWPAHVDREANGIIATLGDFPDDEAFTVAEFHDGANTAAYSEKYPALKKRRTVISSDAHYLWNINERINSFELDDEPYSSAYVRQKLFEYLSGKNE